MLWVMLRFRIWDTVHSTGPFILLLQTWGGHRAPTHRGKMLLTGSWWCFLRSEMMLRGRKKVIFFPEEEGMLRSLRADLGVRK